MLGVRTRQLNGLYDYAGTLDVQIRAWNHIGLFSSNIGRADRYASHAALEDDTATLAQRARAYLDSNCAFCHTKGGATPVSLALNSNISTSAMHAIDVDPSAGDLGLTNARIIASGDHERSVLWQRMNATDNSFRMPPIASVLPHSTALDITAYERQ